MSGLNIDKQLKDLKDVLHYLIEHKENAENSDFYDNINNLINISAELHAANDTVETTASDICHVVIGSYYLATYNDDGIYQPSIAVDHFGEPHFKFLNGAIKPCIRTAAYKLFNCL